MHDAKLTTGGTRRATLGRRHASEAHWDPSQQVRRPVVPSVGSHIHIHTPPPSAHPPGRALPSHAALVATVAPPLLPSTAPPVLSSPPWAEADIAGAEPTRSGLALIRPTNCDPVVDAAAAAEDPAAAPAETTEDGAAGREGVNAVLCGNGGLVLVEADDEVAVVAGRRCRPLPPLPLPAIANGGVAAPSVIATGDAWDATAHTAGDVDGGGDGSGANDGPSPPPWSLPRRLPPTASWARYSSTTGLSFSSAEARKRLAGLVKIAGAGRHSTVSA